MTPERWRHIEDLFQQALDLPAPNRETFLRHACQGDEELHREVVSLLDNDLPEQPLIATESLEEHASDADTEDEVAGRTIGPYRVLKLLGHGGMGAVYLASRQDDVFRKQVAIKLLKRGMDTDSMLTRFRVERQILANLEHPFIARLIDGGATEDGLPYFVMEYVDGQPITNYCAEQSLGIKERLNLFRLVCEAVHYAHRNLVIHRDLKPGNILVTSEGVPKLLDFGIAKVISPDRRDAETLTGADQRLLTPHYASPEQVLGTPSSTSTDIYALGAILYELLTHQRAHQFTSQSSAELERVVCEAEPERPSQAVLKMTEAELRSRRAYARGLRGDLDNIVLTALRKDPQRRYQSVAEFSDDLRRHLEGLPVTAHDDNWSYRAGKFVRRHRWGVAAAALLLATLVGGIAATTYQARRAEQRFNLVRNLANRVLLDLSTQVRQLPGSTPVRNAMIQTVVEYLDALSRDAGSDPAFDFEIANAYYYVGGVEGNPGQANMGQTRASIAHYEKAVDLLTPLTTKGVTKDRAVDVLIRVHLELNRILDVLGETSKAAAHLNAASQIADQAAANGIPLPPAAQANLYNLISRAHSDRGNVPEEQAYARKAMDVAEKWAAEDQSTASMDMLRNVYLSVADSLAHGGNVEGIREAFDKALEVSETISVRPDATFNQRFAPAAIHHLYGDFLGATDDPNIGDPQGALAHYREAVRINGAMAEADPQDVNARRNLSGSYRRVGMMLLDTDPKGALDMYRKAVELSAGIIPGNEDNLQYRSALGSSMIGEGAALHRLGRNREALDVINRTIELQNSVEEANPTLVFLLRITSRSYMIQGDTLLALGKPEEARQAYRAGLDAANRVLSRAPSSLFHMIDRADLLEANGRFYDAQAKADPRSRAESLEAAISCFDQSLGIWQDWLRRGQAVSYATRRLAAAQALRRAVGEQERH